jgi:peptidoglycan hydrolase-like protein with peptidoglycan-binding domain
MKRNLRPALPAFLLLLSAVGLGVPASSAQSKGTAKKKPAASKATTPTAKASPNKAAAPPNATAARSSSLRKSASGSTVKSSARGGSSSRAGKRTSGRSRRQPGQKAPSADRVIEIQAALAKDGSFQGMPNGKWDDDTAAATRRFQAAHGLNPTGRLDALTLQRLGLGSQTAGVAAPTPPPGSVSRLSSSVIAPSSTTETARRQ